MMETQTLDEKFKVYLPKIIRWSTALLVPIICSTVAQSYYSLEGSLNVYLNPPGRIYPVASLEWLWWLILVFGTLIFCGLTTTRRLPRRLFYTAYIYLIFILIFVKPV